MNSLISKHYMTCLFEKHIMLFRNQKTLLQTIIHSNYNTKWKKKQYPKKIKNRQYHKNILICIDFFVIFEQKPKEITILEIFS